MHSDSRAQERRWEVTQDILGDGATFASPEVLPRWRTTATLRERIAALEKELERTAFDKRETRRRAGCFTARAVMHGSWCRRADIAHRQTFLRP